MVGQALGSVNDGVPTVPLEADLLAHLPHPAGPTPGTEVRFHDLDLRRPIDQARSQLFHRLRLLGLRWITPAESAVQSQGTFRETWQSRWEPEYSVPSSRHASGARRWSRQRARGWTRSSPRDPWSS